MAIGGHQVGPVSRDDVVTNLRNGDDRRKHAGLRCQALTNWTPLKDVPRAGSLPDRRAPGPARLPRRRRSCPAARRAHEIDFRILGSEMQFVEVELDPGESAVAEAGLDDGT